MIKCVSCVTSTFRPIECVVILTLRILKYSVKCFGYNPIMAIVRILIILNEISLLLLIFYYHNIFDNL